MIAPIPPGGLDIQELTRGGRCTLLMAGELDIASVPSLEAAVARVCARGTSELTLDLSRLRFIDSTGLAAIVLASKLCERSGYRFSLVPGPSAVQRLFELTGLLDVLPFSDSEGRAPGSGDDNLRA